MPWPRPAYIPAGTPGGISITGNIAGGLVIPWVATARDRTTNDTDNGDINDPATRTAQACYMRGLKETIEISTGSPHTWRWRRICFTLKGGDLLATNAGVSMPLYLETSGGYARALTNVNVAGQTDALEMRDKLVELMFKGKFNTDWLNGYSAKLDTDRITPLYDKVVHLRSGNDRGSSWIFKRWHPMNKNLVYADDEDGGGEDQTFYSSTGNHGMGDYYVVDLLEPALGASEGDQLIFKPQATLYWHER